MKIFVIRTRLQALIVREIIESEAAIRKRTKFIFAFVYQNNMQEDSEEVYELYDELKRKSTFCVNVVSSEGFLNNFFKFLFLNLLAAFSGGQFYLAGIDGYPFALAARFFPFVKINTFDDGSANILSYSKYYQEAPLSDKGLKRKLLKKVFPNGCAKYLRDRVALHYTIFPGFNNIVPENKIVALKWRWEKFLDKRDLRYLNDGLSKIVLGTVFDDHANPEEMKKNAHNVLMDSDIYIRHPREASWIKNKKVVSLYSPAEAVLSFLAADQEITVYHFNTTAAYSLCGHRNIKFVDLAGKS